jgi:DNA-binding transcriptional LysR family regulator
MSHQGEGGPINLAAVPTFATRWLLPRLPQLAQQHPDITVHIDVQTRPFLFADTVFDAGPMRARPSRWPAGPACRRSG